ncbi:MAG: tetratricopeptide repeat protein [Candidatus Helarchaeota archaeon]|nr:tetratricopeptide repeat protein [Candidatus Helarchaeota archaeon]
MTFGELLIKVDRTGEAMGCYEQALRIKRNLGDDRGVAECLKNMGTGFFNRGKYIKAKQYYEKAREAFQNQALVLEVKEIDKLLDKIKERPYPEEGCEICETQCAPDIVGLAHESVVQDTFTGPFKQVLRESLSLKNMDKLVDLLLDTSRMNPDLQSHNISQDAFAFCLMVQATNIHLEQLNKAQKEQMIKMVQDNIKTRRYRQML